MIKKTLPLIAVALLASTTTAYVHAGSDVTVYGKVNVSLQQLEEDKTVAGVSSDVKDNWELLSNASRFGLKGKTDLDFAGLSAIYKLEYEVGVDDGDVKGSELSQRNIYGGFTSGFGTLIAGKFDTALKISQKKVDLFNDLTYGDIKNVLEGENRESNSIQYSTPKMSGFQANIDLILGEEDGVTPGQNDSGITDRFSASLTYDSDNLYFAVAIDDNVDKQDVIRLVGQFKISDLTLGALIQKANLSKPLPGVKDDEDAYVLSAKYKIGEGAIKVQYAMSEANVSAIDDKEKEAISLGYDHKLGKKTKVYAYYTDWSEETSPIDEQSKQTLAVGFEHKF